MNQITKHQIYDAYNTSIIDRTWRTQIIFKDKITLAIKLHTHTQRKKIPVMALEMFKNVQIKIIDLVIRHNHKKKYYGRSTSLSFFSIWNSLRFLCRKKKKQTFNFTFHVTLHHFARHKYMKVHFNYHETFGSIHLLNFK